MTPSQFAERLHKYPNLKERFTRFYELFLSELPLTDVPNWTKVRAMADLMAAGYPVAKDSMGCYAIGGVSITPPKRWIERDGKLVLRSG
jgi:hypothetical protein